MEADFGFERFAMAAFEDDDDDEMEGAWEEEEEEDGDPGNEYETEEGRGSANRETIIDSFIL